MKKNKLKFFILLVFIVSISIFFGVAFYKVQSTQPQTPVSPIASTTLSPTSPPLTVNPTENLFGNSSCSLPCWQGITPGITTSSEALERLNSSPLVLRNSIQSEESKISQGRADWRWKMDDKQLYEKGNIVWTGGIIRIMELTTLTMSH